MISTLDLMYARLFIRLLLGLILLSVGISKLRNPTSFRRGIQDYRLFSPALEAKLRLSHVLSFALPLAELLVGVGLVSGLVFIPTAILALLLFVTFSGAMLINLIRGRRDLSCHCAGALGDHHISWWLIGRNGVFIVCLLLLLFTPADIFTVGTIVRSPSSVNVTLWLNMLLPVVVLLVGIVLVVLVLFNAARTLWHS
jgi:uncharacterized membrane protein YphA (DoxX/SURF4 family)